MDHGEMWADLLLISPLTAYLVCKYQIPHIHIITSLWIFTGVLIAWTTLTLFVFAPAGANTPEAHAHGGHVSLTGWIHVLYASLSTLVIVTVYIPHFVSPATSNTDIWIVTVILSVWAFFGVKKFNTHWKWGGNEILQVSSMIVGLFAIAIWRTL